MHSTWSLQLIARPLVMTGHRFPSIVIIVRAIDAHHIHASAYEFTHDSVITRRLTRHRHHYPHGAAWSMSSQ
jgi:hypothetical protein